MVLNYFHISTLPRLHEIVWCLPPIDSSGNPGTKVRPVLVRGSLRDPGTGRGALMVSYGTTKLDVAKNQFSDLIIQNAERLAQLELPSAVRFDLSLTNRLPWAQEFF